MQTETLPQQKIEVGSMVIVGLTAYYVEEVWQMENTIIGIDQDGHEEEIHMSRIDSISNQQNTRREDGEDKPIKLCKHCHSQWALNKQFCGHCGNQQSPRGRH